MGGPERLVELPGWSAGEATAKLVELATQQGYTVAATAPGTYRLARIRRKLLSKTTESVVASVFSDRTGTKARIVGSLDPAILEHLTYDGRHVLGSIPPAPTSTPAALPSTPPTPPTPDAHVEHEPRTIARSSIRPARTADVTVVLSLPDGRTVSLEQPVVVGRNPDPALGLPTARPVAIADPSISKSHAAIALTDGVVWVTDLHSTNGTAIETSGATAACPPGERCRVELGGTIVAGDVRLRIGGSS